MRYLADENIAAGDPVPCTWAWHFRQRLASRSTSIFVELIRTVWRYGNTTQPSRNAGCSKHERARLLAMALGALLVQARAWRGHQPVS